MTIDLKKQLNIDKRKWTEILGYVDTDHDGVVSYEEFESSFHEFIN